MTAPRGSFLPRISTTDLKSYTNHKFRSRHLSRTVMACRCALTAEGSRASLCGATVGGDKPSLSRSSECASTCALGSVCAIADCCVTSVPMRLCGTATGDAGRELGLGTGGGGVDGKRGKVAILSLFPLLAGTGGGSRLGGGRPARGGEASAAAAAAAAVGAVRPGEEPRAGSRCGGVAGRGKGRGGRGDGVRCAMEGSFNSSVPK